MRAPNLSGREIVRDCHQRHLVSLLLPMAARSRGWLSQDFFTAPVGRSAEPLEVRGPPKAR